MVRVIFKVVPMMNPDGVILGNFRTGLGGKDLNREFHNPDKLLFPTACSLKSLVTSLKKDFGENVLGFIDLHGHSVKKNIFIYG